MQAILVGSSVSRDVKDRSAKRDHKISVAIQLAQVGVSAIAGAKQMLGVLTVAALRDLIDGLR